MNILLVEDDALIAAGLQTALSRALHQVSWVADGLQARDRLRAETFDLVILDLGLPGLDGLEVLKGLRASGAAVSVLILSARDGAHDRIQGLDLGADDYLTKPFELDELLARVRALARRRANRATNALSQGGLVLDINAMTVHWNGTLVEIPRREWALLRLLMEHPERVYSRGQIEDALYGWGESAESNAIDVHVHHLRRKLFPAVIQTVRGVGYRLGQTT